MKITSTQILERARTKGWDKVREAIYGQGEEFDVFRASHEATAMSLFINSRQNHVIEKAYKSLGITTLAVEGVDESQRLND